MKALIEYRNCTFGCQKWINDELANISSFTDKSIVIEFETNKKLTPEVSALKKFYAEHLPFQYGNSVTFVKIVKVTIL